MVINVQDDNIHTYDNGFHPKPVKLKENYKFYNLNIFFRITSIIIIWLTVFVLFFVKRICWGFKLKGRQNIKKVKGAITISNHVLQQDAFLTVSSFVPKKLYVTMLESNLGFGIVSKYLRMAGAVPIPNDRHLFKRFLEETKTILNKNKFVHIYPEAALKPYNYHIRNFKEGAFHIAYSTKMPIIPMVITFHKPKGIYKLYKKKPLLHLNILEPYSPDFSLNKKEAIQKMHEDLFKIMDDFYKKTSDYND